MPIILVITGIFSLLVLAVSLRAILEDRFTESLALAFVLAGALGNLYDRVTWHFVFDWILFFNRSVINLADAWISIGAIWYLISIEQRARETQSLPLTDGAK